MANNKYINLNSCFIYKTTELVIQMTGVSCPGIDSTLNKF